jgi:hypothetical protein
VESDSVVVKASEADSQDAPALMVDVRDLLVVRE